MLDIQKMHDILLQWESMEGGWSNETREGVMKQEKNVSHLFLNIRTMNSFGNTFLILCLPIF